MGEFLDLMCPKSKVATGWCTCLLPDSPFNIFLTLLLGTTTTDSRYNMGKFIYWYIYFFVTNRFEWLEHVVAG